MVSVVYFLAFLLIDFYLNLIVWLDELPSYILIDRCNNSKSIFYYTKTFRKNKEKSENEFLGLDYLFSFSCLCDF